MTDLNLDAPCTMQARPNVIPNLTATMTVRNVSNHNAVSAQHAQIDLPLKSHGHTQSSQWFAPLSVNLNVSSLANHAQSIPIDDYSVSLMAINCAMMSKEIAVNPLVVFNPQMLANHSPETHIPNLQLNMSLQHSPMHVPTTAPTEQGDYLAVGRGIRITASKRTVIS